MHARRQSCSWRRRSAARVPGGAVELGGTSHVKKESISGAVGSLSAGPVSSHPAQWVLGLGAEAG